MTDQSSSLMTLGDVLSAMAVYVGGSVPPTSDIEYANWVRFINMAQDDAATRGFWSRLLIKSTLNITAGVSTAVLPDNFHKRNGIYILDVDGIDWADKANEQGQKLHVYRDPATAAWTVIFNGFTPLVNVTATLWYFFLPPKLTAESDPVFLDGKMLLYYALTEYYRQSGELGSLDDARNEYINRFSEGLNLDQLPAKNELVSWQSDNSYRHLGNEKNYYRGRR